MSSFFCCCTTCYTMPETSVAKSYMHSLYCKCMYPWFLFHLFLHINVYLELGTSGIVEKSSGSIECTCSASFSTHIYTPKQSLFCRKHMWDFGSIFVFWSFFFFCAIFCVFWTFFTCPILSGYPFPIRLTSPMMGYLAARGQHWSKEDHLYLMGQLYLHSTIWLISKLHYPVSQVMVSVHHFVLQVLPALVTLKELSIN